MSKKPWHSFRRYLLIGALALLCLAVAYDPSRMENTSGDNISLRYWPVAILRHHSLKLNYISKDLHDVAYAAVFKANGDWLPRAEVRTLAFTLPFYAVMDFFQHRRHRMDHTRIHQASKWEAVLISTLSVILLFLLLCRFLRTVRPLSRRRSLQSELTTGAWARRECRHRPSGSFFISLVSTFCGSLRSPRIRASALNSPWPTACSGFAYSCRASTLFMSLGAFLLLPPLWNWLVFAVSATSSSFR